MAPTIPVYTLQLPVTIINGIMHFNGGITTAHDAKWFWPEDMTPEVPVTGSGGYADFTPEIFTDNAPSHWDFDQTLVERIKFKWTPSDLGLGWDSFTFRIAWLNPGVGTGNVVWQFLHHAITFATVPTSAPVIVNTLAPIAAPSVLGLGWNYTDIAINVPVVRGPLGEDPIYQTVIKRVANDAGDTCNGDVGIFGVSVTRQPQGV